jgi:hypothetical protein
MSAQSYSQEKTTDTSQSMSTAQAKTLFVSLSLSQRRALVGDFSDDHGKYEDEFDIDQEGTDDDNSNEEIEGEFDQIIDDTSTLALVDGTESPLIDLNDIDAITVIKNSRGDYSCIYEPPIWMTSRVNPFFREPIGKIVSFIIKIAKYFEQHQQGFLMNPQRDNFVFTGKLTQKHFIQIVSEGEDLLEEKDFGYLKKTLWLIWEDSLVNLGAIFDG